MYDELDDEKQSSISVSWVLTEKLIERKTQVKARLVARGFEDAGRDDVRKNSPTCERENLRLLFALTSSCNWRIDTLDIKSAFLQTRKLKRVVKSTLTAETLALQEVIEAAIMIKAMFLEILNVDAHNQILPIKCVTDSKSLHDAVYSTKTLTEKWLKIELCAIRESLEKQEIHSVIWVCSEDQLADCLTKEGASREKLYDKLSGKVKLLN